MQHVIGPIDNLGHTLDVLITHTDDKPVALVIDEPSLSDHAFITADLDVLIDNCRPVVSVIERRQWRGFHVHSFSADLATSKLIVDPPVDVT